MIRASIFVRILPELDGMVESIQRCLAAKNKNLAPCFGRYETGRSDLAIKDVSHTSDVKSRQVVECSEKTSSNLMALSHSTYIHHLQHERNLATKYFQKTSFPRG